MGDNIGGKISLMLGFFSISKPTHQIYCGIFDLPYVKYRARPHIQISGSLFGFVNSKTCDWLMRFMQVILLVSHWSEDVDPPNLYLGQAGAWIDGTSVQCIGIVDISSVKRRRPNSSIPKTKIIGDKFLTLKNRDKVPSPN